MKKVVLMFLVLCYISCKKEEIKPIQQTPVNTPIQFPNTPDLTLPGLNFII